MSIKIYSWNICFGCMYSNEKSSLDKTAKQISNYCKERHDITGENVCLNNVVKQMSKYKYDFIGLQEATNYNLIYDKLQQIYPSYRYTYSKCGPEEMITIYDSDRFELDYVTVGELDLVLKGRPYQILFLTEKATNKKFIVINLHPPHSFYDENGQKIHNKDKIKLQFSKMLSKELPASYFNNKLTNNLDNIQNTDNILSYINNFASEFNTIVMGDFNDHTHYDTWQNFKPFFSSDLKIKDINVNSIVQPPNTCCVGNSNLRKNKGEDFTYGDYILIDTEKMEYIKNNQIPILSTFFDATTNPTSDHLPVFSEIKIKEKSILDVLLKPLDNLFPIVSNKVFKLNSGSKTLRLQANGIDPNGPGNNKINNNFFKGFGISSADKLIFPNGKEVNGFVLVVDKNNPNIIGYIRKSYLKPVDDYFVIDSPDKKLLRLQADPSMPNNTDGLLNGKPFRGNIVDNTNQFVYPDGREVSVDFNEKKIVYVIIQKKDDPSVFGYVNKDYLIETQSGGYYEKYKKYKSKYLKLKNNHVIN